jgi:hypothetical protein
LRTGGEDGVGQPWPRRSWPAERLAGETDAPALGFVGGCSNGGKITTQPVDTDVRHMLEQGA